MTLQEFCETNISTVANYTVTEYNTVNNGGLTKKAFRREDFKKYCDESGKRSVLTMNFTTSDQGLMCFLSVGGTR